MTNRILVTLLLLTTVLTSSNSAGAKDLWYHDGPIMKAAKIHLIFWLPDSGPGCSSGCKYDPGVTDGVGNYETRIRSFFSNLSGTSYYDILTQYPGPCALEEPFPEGCHGTVSVDQFVDKRNYPRTGSVTDPLKNSDIQDEVTRAIAKKGWHPGLHDLFMVFLGAGIEECASDGTTCSFNSFCGYHSAFIADKHVALYAVMPSVISIPGCTEGVGTAPGGQLSTDREIVLASHEALEAMTDPSSFFEGDGQIAGWWNSDGAEISDICNQDVGTVQPDGSNVSLHGHRFVVQEQWSNDDAACVLGFSPAISGRTVEVDTRTGDNALAHQSAAGIDLEDEKHSSFQHDTLKKKGQSAWSTDSLHVRVFQFAPLHASKLGAAVVTLTPDAHEADRWLVNDLRIKVRDSRGLPECRVHRSGSPYMTLTNEKNTAGLQIAECETFDQAQFEFMTNDDNLRQSSSVSGALHFTDGASQKFTIKAQDSKSWEQFDFKTMTESISPARHFDDVKSVSVTLTSHPDLTETPDNWDMKAFSVELSSAGKHPLCFVDRSGNPFVRLTGEKPTVTLDRGSGCP